MLKPEDDACRQLEQALGLPAATLKPKDIERIGRQLKQAFSGWPRTEQTGWTYVVDTAGMYTLSHNGVVKGRGRHADAAQRRLRDFESKLPGGHAAARLRRFQLDNALTAQGL